MSLSSTESLGRPAPSPRGRPGEATPPSVRSFHRVIAHGEWDDAYFTEVATSPLVEDGELTQAFDALAAGLAAGGTIPVQERVYGLQSERLRILAARAVSFARHGLDSGLPVTFLEGAPCIGGALAGVQVIGVAPRGPNVRVETLREGGAAIGCEVRLPGQRLVYLSGVSGAVAGSDPSVTGQGTRMFARAGALLAAQDLSPRDIARTWIYLPRILDWYGEFNRVRTTWFRETGIIASDGRGVLPASTGILGRRAPGEECFMDVLAVARDRSSAGGAAQMHSARQNEPAEYGSSFSRGMVVGPAPNPTLYVSGTASIDSRGRTVHHGDAQGQVLETLLDIAVLLEGQGARLRDLCQATAYCKGLRDYRAFRTLLEHLDLDEIPFLPVLADVCRHELLFEVDAIAVPGSGPSKATGPGCEEA